jgi:hypothetical protein
VGLNERLLFFAPFLSRKPDGHTPALPILGPESAYGLFHESVQGILQIVLPKKFKQTVFTFSFFNKIPCELQWLEYYRSLPTLFIPSTYLQKKNSFLF